MSTPKQKRDRYHADPQKARRKSRRLYLRRRQVLFEIYGDHCAHCGFEDERALSLDHVKDNGSEERTRLGRHGVYKRARDEYLPEEYQILCMNCQFIKAAEYREREFEDQEKKRS
jgi:hypothetical protein